MCALDNKSKPVDSVCPSSTVWVPLRPTFSVYLQRKKEVQRQCVSKKGEKDKMREAHHHWFTNEKTHVNMQKPVKMAVVYTCNKFCTLYMI